MAGQTNPAPMALTVWEGCFLVVQGLSECDSVVAELLLGGTEPSLRLPQRRVVHSECCILNHPQSTAKTQGEADIEGLSSKCQFAMLITAKRQASREMVLYTYLAHTDF